MQLFQVQAGQVAHLDIFEMSPQPLDRISGDTIEWRSVKVILATLIRTFRSETRISYMAVRLTDRHSGHPTQFKTEISKMSPEFYRFLVIRYRLGCSCNHSLARP
jgi:hypothetical protein